MVEGISITKKQFKKYSRIGNSLIKKRLTTGFNIEDFNPSNTTKQVFIYGHDNPAHVRIIQRSVGGRNYPRVSLYKWKKEFGQVGKNTKLQQKGTLAYEKGLYLETPKIKKGIKYAENNTFMLYNKKPIKYSWDVPDIRVYNQQKLRPRFHRAWLVTKNIDENSRLGTLIVRKDKLAGIRKVLVGEKVRNVQVQDYYRNGKRGNASFWQYLRDLSK